MKKLYFTTLLAVCFAFSAASQNRIGGVRIFPITLQEVDESLMLEMDVHVDGKSMNRCQSWTIMPSIQTADSSYVVELPRALVNGQRKAKLFKRKEKYGNIWLTENYPQYKIDKKSDNDVTFTYSIELPYELWMDTAALHINQILNSCADVDQWFTLENVAKVQLKPYAPYQVDPRVNYITPVKEVKTLHLEGSAFLDFQVGRSEILPNFRRNPQELAKIDEVLSQVRDNSDFEISALQITGYASPEGSWQSNDRLSLARSEALRRYIQTKFPIPTDLIKVSNVAEDWEGLKRMVTEGEMNGKYRVLELIETVADPDVRESRLKVLDGGRPYRYMLTELFPALRRVVYRVEFTVKEYSLEETDALLEKNPEQLNHYELFTLYQSYPQGSVERDKIFDIIMRMFPDDPVANLNAAGRMLELGETTTARRYLDKAGEGPEAYNNIGVYYLMMEDTARAEEYFSKAADAAQRDEAGYSREDIDHNTQELIRKQHDLKTRQRYLK